MKCPVCGIEMRRKTVDTWECRNPKCIQFGKEQREDGNERE